MSYAGMYLEQAAEEFAMLRKIYRRADGKPWKAGDTLKLPILGKTLRAIAATPDALYQGPLAEQLAAAMAGGDGIITTDDLSNYQAKLRKPIHGTYRDYDIWGPPPPSSGGVCSSAPLTA